MKNLRKIFSLILCVSLVLGTFAAGGMTASADTVYTVTLDPGEGIGEPIVYRSSDQTEFPGWHDAQYFQFYLEDDGRMGFRFKINYVPDSFTAPAGYEFDGWQGAIQYNILNSTETVFTAKWRFVYDPNGARYSLSPSEYTIENSGYTDIPCSFDSLYLGNVTYGNSTYQANEILFYINAGTLTDGNGSSIPFLVDDEFHFGAEERIYTGNGYSSQEETFIMSVWIDPEEYAAAAPGTYTGELVYDSLWFSFEAGDIAGESGSIALTLVIPEQETVYTVTLDPGEGSGEPIVFRSSDQTEFPGWHDAQDFQFYLKDNGEMGFRFNDSYVPDSFTAPGGYEFDGWQGATGFNNFPSGVTDIVFTAKWRKGPASYSLSPSEYTIENSGYTDIACSFDSLYLGNVTDGNNNTYQAEGIDLYINAGTLTDGNGSSIPFLVDNEFRFGAEDRIYTGNTYSSQEDTFIMSVWIDPEDYAAAAPGTYTGELVYDSEWFARVAIAGESGSIALTLVIPEPSIEEPSITATISANEVVRGDKLTWNITTQADVTWLKFNGTDESGNAYTSYYKYSNYNKGTTEASVTDTDAGRVWNIPMVFNYAGTQAVDNQTWTIEYRVSGSNEWKSAPGEPFNIKVGKNAAALAPAPEEGEFAPYSILAAVSEDREENGAAYKYFYITTTDDVSKVKISFINDETGKTKSATYQTTSTNVVDLDTANGFSVWTIRMKVTAQAQDNAYTVQVRGPAWGEGVVVLSRQ